MAVETNEVRKDLDGKPMEAPRDLTKERNDRCVPIAQEIVKIMAKAPVVLDPKSTDAFDLYVPLYQEVATMLKEKGVKLSEVGYCFALARQCGIMLEDLTGQSLNKHVAQANEKFWGKPDSEVTVTDLDAQVK